MRLAAKYACRHRGNPAAGLAHDHGHGQPPRRKCSRCGGKLYAERGLWGVFRWARGSGIYPYADAIRTYTVYAAADRYADLPDSKAQGLVTRWIPESQIPAEGDEGDGTAESAQAARTGAGARDRAADQSGR